MATSNHQSVWFAQLVRIVVSPVAMFWTSVLNVLKVIIEILPPCLIVIALRDIMMQVILHANHVTIDALPA